MKKLAYFLMALTLAFGFTACDKDDDPKTDPTENPNPTDPNNPTNPVNILGRWVFESAEFKEAKFGSSALEAQLKAWMDENKAEITQGMADFAGDEFEFLSDGKLNIYSNDGYVEHNTYTLTGNRLEVTDEDGWKSVSTVSVQGNKLFLDTDGVEVFPEAFPSGITAFVARAIFIKKN